MQTDLAAPFSLVRLLHEYKDVESCPANCNFHQHFRYTFADTEINSNLASNLIDKIDSVT
jgi:hypothetical protein